MERETEPAKIPGGSLPEDCATLAEARGALAEARGSLAETRAALEETQAALRHTQDVLRQQQSAQAETLAALRHTQEVMRQHQEDSQTALRHTQDVLWQHQIASGLIDKTSEMPVEPDRSLPSILLIAPPKTAGAYIMNTLLYGLRLERRWVSLGYFGSPDLFRHWILDAFWRDGGCIAFQHTDASATNLHFLKQTDLAIIVNVRDPRECLNSLVHYNLQHFPRPTHILQPAEPPNDYPDWSLERQIGWEIDMLLPNYVDWLNGWLDAVDRGDVRALITRYDDLVQDEEAFFEAILSFYAIPKEKFAHPRLALDTKVNFRSADPDEWRRVFTDEQKRRALTMIPDRLMTRFGWLE